MTIQATSAPAFRKLIGLMMDFYSQSLLNPHWGEQIRFRPDNSVKISMVFQGLDRSRAKAVWQPFLDSLAARTNSRLISDSSASWRSRPGTSGHPR